MGAAIIQGLMMPDLRGCHFFGKDSSLSHL